MYIKKNKAFTLVELLVVISIIGVLSSTIFATLNSSKAKARDTKRISELTQLKKAISLYSEDNGETTPGSGHYASSNECITSGLLLLGTPLWTNAGVFDATFKSKYMNNLPNDPTGSCISYSDFEVAGTGWTCVDAGGAVIDPDNIYKFIFTFESESNLSRNTYPGLGGAGGLGGQAATRRCFFGEPK